MIARKGTKVRRPLISTRIRPAARRRSRPVSMSDPKARAFFGAVQYTERPKTERPARPVVD